MDILAIIDKKRLKQQLSYEELDYAFNAYLNKKIPDYQMSALLMAICINELDDQEIFDLTDIFLKSGDILDLSNISGIVVDKHSTGGVGDKTTLVIGPIVASCGLKMAKMSGRGLGLTGGTIDKLESIPGFDVNLTEEEFLNQVEKVGFANISQSNKLVPMDKVIYALRDVTSTACSLGLIAVSIMSKKLASGADHILLDVKYGKGALMKTKEEALKFDTIVKKIGKKYNKNVETVIDAMNIPLGNNIGNSLEILEVIDILKGKQGYLTNLCLKLSATLICMALNISYDESYQKAQEVLENKQAYNKFLEFVTAQKGDLSKIKVSDKKIEIKSSCSGILKSIDAQKIALLASKIGCFRKSKDDILDYSVGIVINKNINDYINENDILAYLYVNDINMNLTKDDIECFKIEEE